MRAEIDTLLRPDAPRRLGTLPALPPMPALPSAITHAAQLARRGHTVSARISCRKVVDMFQGDEQLYSMPVLDDTNRPIGVLRSMQVMKRSAERYFMDIHERQGCVELMDPRPLVFDVSTSLRAMSEAIANLDDRLMVDGFIVTEDGRYFGGGRTSDLLKAVSDLQVNSARHANPLTLLPGNVPIDHHVDALLATARPFVVALWDIDSFKPFNDVCGYRCGDDVIKFTAQVLLQAADPELDFVGHIGGDDFLMVLTSPDWQARLQRVCALFDAGLRGYFTAEHLLQGGYVPLNRPRERGVTQGMDIDKMPLKQATPAGVGNPHSHPLMELSMRATLIRTLIAAAALVGAGAAQAAAVTSYDITNAQLSGFGGWSHSYTGTIVGNNYSGGSGTLNDGFLPSDYNNNQLFWLSDGATITLHLDALTTVGTIDLLGGVTPSNYIPGTLTGWSVTIGGNTVDFASTDFGPGCSSGMCNDRVDLTGSGLENLATTTITLSNFQGGWNGYFSIGELAVGGAAASDVPEPAGIALTLAALGAAGLARARRRGKA